jgi:hypothetical protein
MDVIVAQDKPDITTTTIATYSMSPCYFFLLDGYYQEDKQNNRPFAYVNHHSKWIEFGSKTPIDLLSSFLKTLSLI